MTHGGARSGAGRIKGAPSKKTQEIIDKLEELDCDPIEGMAEIARLSRASGDLALAGNMYKELAQYIAPKRKAIEHSVEKGKELRVSWMQPEPEEKPQAPQKKPAKRSTKKAGTTKATK